MCPILDFANHTSSTTHIVPVMPDSLFSSAPGSRKNNKKSAHMGGDYMFISSSRAIQKDDELFLQYGAHSNRKLFIEYGFVNTFAEGDCLRGDFVGEVDLQDILEAMFSTRGGDVGKWMKEVLEEEGYWGYSCSLPCMYDKTSANIFYLIWLSDGYSDWTMHSSPTPAHPSYRLIAALRLYHTVSESAGSVPANSEELVDAWRRVLIGQEERISEENEQAWRGTLSRICESVVHGKICVPTNLSLRIWTVRW